MDLQAFPVEPITHVDVRQAWIETKSKQLKSASCLVAEYFGITEAEVVASGCGHFVKRLCGDWRELLYSLNALGPLRIQIQSGRLLHEVVMDFVNPLAALDNRLIFRDGKNRLKLENNRLQIAFLVSESALGIRQLGISFFDLDGSLVMKIIIPSERENLCLSLLKRHIHPNQSTKQSVVHLSYTLPTPSWPQSDIENLRNDWKKLTTREGIWLLLAQYGISYRRLMDMLAAPLVKPFPKGSFRVLLEVGLDHLTPFNLTSFSAGCVMDWSGTISQVIGSDNNLYIKGERMKLRCEENEIDEGWLVELPGTSTPSLAEFFDAQGKHLLSVTIPHNTNQYNDIKGWRDIVDILVTLDW